MIALLKIIIVINQKYFEYVKINKRIISIIIKIHIFTIENMNKLPTYLGIFAIDPKSASK